MRAIDLFCLIWMAPDRMTVAQLRRLIIRATHAPIPRPTRRGDEMTDAKTPRIKPFFRIACGGIIETRYGVKVVSVHAKSMRLDEAARIEAVILKALNEEFPAPPRPTRTGGGNDMVPRPTHGLSLCAGGGDMARELIMATLGEQEGDVVGQAQALARFRDVADGLAQRSRALRLLGNGVVPLAAAHAWRTRSFPRPLALGSGCRRFRRRNPNNSPCFEGLNQCVISP